MFTTTSKQATTSRGASKWVAFGALNLMCFLLLAEQVNLVAGATNRELTKQLQRTCLANSRAPVLNEQLLQASYETLLEIFHDKEEMYSLIRDSYGLFSDEINQTNNKRGGPKRVDVLARHSSRVCGMLASLWEMLTAAGNQL